MNGYVKNKTHNWVHAMKRVIGPGIKISLSELYKQYGEKHGIHDGEPFVQWLREVKLKDRDKWEITLINENDNLKDENTVEELEAIANTIHDNVAPMVPRKMEVGEIVELSVRKARELLPKITDLNLLKYSLAEANPRAGKDSLCNILRKRIKELQIAR
jgi:hypothetical protein